MDIILANTAFCAVNYTVEYTFKSRGVIQKQLIPLLLFAMLLAYLRYDVAGNIHTQFKILSQTERYDTK